nr:patatin-like phospholipase family protein [Candidatus Cloacimonadota bacterium]
MKKIAFLFLILFPVTIFCRQSIGLALSGGGARGLAHIGVLKEIDRSGIQIDYISGTSTGAIIGGLYAMGYSGLEIEKIFKEFQWQEILNEKIHRENISIGLKRWKPYANYNFDLDENFLPQLPQAFLSGNNLINKLFELTFPVEHIENFDDLKIPFRCVATNILNGEMKVFSSGSLHEAMRASMSFPSILQPFEIDDEYFVDGGISANLPSKALLEMGAELIIGVQTSSQLKTISELQSMIDVLDQTVSLNIIKNINSSAEICDFLIKPDLENVTKFDFSRQAEIITAGEISAKEILSEFADKIEKIRSSDKNHLQEKISFAKIYTSGNKYLSNAKIKEFVGLKENTPYSKSEIIKAFDNAYNSALFNFIYPDIVLQNSEYQLRIAVREKNRKLLGFNLSYNENNEIVSGLTLELNNYLQKNSKLLFNIQIGDRHELNLDYVKNFGRHWGVYFRLFPYLSEFKLISYNEDHEKMNSVKSLEIGSTFGIGFFAQQLLALELFGYSFRTNLYRDVAEFENRNFQATGYGIKMYHENLDDYVFPMKGSQALLKFSTAERVFFSDEGFRKFYTKFKFLLPFGKNISLKYQFEYGSYFNNFSVDFDPFYIGGLDSFLGLHVHEKSAPIYKINTV